MKTRVRGRAHQCGDAVGELDLVGVHAPDWRPNDLHVLLDRLPHRLGLSPTAPLERGDLLVAGHAFGAETRTDWPAVLLALRGVAAVLCESVLPAMREACLHAGLPVLVHPGMRQMVRDGDDVIVNLEAGTIENVTARRIYVGTGFTPTELRILQEAPTRSLLGVRDVPLDPDVIEEAAPRPPAPQPAEPNLPHPQA